MKRVPLPPRKTTIKRSTTPIRKSGPTKAKKVIRQRAFYASAAWKRFRKEALERATHRCEHLIRFGGIQVRCPETEDLHVHHVRNSHFGGQERPEDLQCLCRIHHALVEARDFPYRQRKWA